MDSPKDTETVNSKSKPFFITKDVSVHSEITLKDRARVLLLRKGISQNKLADEIGIGIGTMSKIVNEEWKPTSMIMIRIAHVLECDSLVLFGPKEYWYEWLLSVGYKVKGYTSPFDYPLFQFQS